MRNEVVVNLAETDLRRAVIFAGVGTFRVDDSIVGWRAEHLVDPRLVDLFELHASLAHGEDVLELSAEQLDRCVSLVIK